MSLSLVQSRALLGLEAADVTVEVHLANGLPSFTLVGLAETEVKESRDRVRSAIQNAGLEFPQQQKDRGEPGAGRPAEGLRPLRPADRAGHPGGQRADPGRALAGHEFAGELSLSGELRPVRGALAMAWPCTRAAPRRSWCCRRTARRRPRWCPARGVRREAPARCGAAVPARGRQGRRPSRRRWLGADPRHTGRRRIAVRRPGRGQGPCRSQARARDRRGRRPQPVDGGRAGFGQVDARAALCRPAAGDEHRRGAGERRRRQPGRALRDGAAGCAGRPRSAASHLFRAWRWWAAARRRGRARFR
jgi:hypothetical protein